MSKKMDTSEISKITKKNPRETLGVTFPVHVKDPEERIRAYMAYYKLPDSEAGVGFDSVLMRDQLKLVSASAAPRVKATFEFRVVRELCNRMENMHGGAVSLVYDMCTTMAMAPISTLDFWFFGGVSRTLSVTYLRPAEMGTDVLVECELLQIGTRLATISGRMISKKDGKLLSVAEHNKVSVTLPAKSAL